MSEPTIDERPETAHGPELPATGDSLTQEDLAELRLATEEEESTADSEVPTPSPYLWLPLFLYLVAVLAFGLFAVDGDLDKELPHESGWLFVPIFLYLAVGSLAAGRTPLRGEPVKRTENPRAFWGVVGLYFALALLMALMGLGAFAG